MGRKARHHYIPKCYLKGFTEGGEDSSPFWCVPINNDPPFQTSPNDSCAKRDYYTVEHSNSLIVEDFYAKDVEPKISNAINYIKENSSLPPKEEMRDLILLLATLYLRVPSFRESLEMPRKRTKEIIESIRQDVSISNRAEFDYSQTDLIMSELKLIDKVQMCLSNKYYQLHVIDDIETNAVTSDFPFLLSHPKGRKGFYFGLNTPNIEICVPITRKAIVIARNEIMNEGVFVANSEVVGLANRKQVHSASRFFYSCNTNILLVDDDIAVYKYDIITNKALHRATR